MKRMAFEQSVGFLMSTAFVAVAMIALTSLSVPHCAQAAPSVTPLGMTDSYGVRLSAMDSDRPSLLKGLMAPDPRSDAAFRERLSAQFKGPVKEASLTEFLVKQGFKVSANADEAYFSESIYPCLYLWRITWDEDADHNIHRLSGRTRSSCA